MHGSVWREHCAGGGAKCGSYHLIDEDLGLEGALRSLECGGRVLKVGQRWEVLNKHAASNGRGETHRHDEVARSFGER